MHNNEDTYHLFLKHSRNELSAEEQTLFDQLIATDTEFKREFDAFEITQNALLFNELALIKDISIKAEKKHTKQQQVKKALIISGLLIVLIGIVTTFFFIPDTADSNTPNPTGHKTSNTDDEILNQEKHLNAPEADVPTKTTNIIQDNSPQPIIEQTPLVTFESKTDSQTTLAVSDNKTIIPSHKNGTDIMNTNHTDTTDLKKPPTASIDCSSFNVTTTTTGSCMGNSTGQLSLTSKSPLQEVIFEGESYLSKKEFLDLAAGDYLIDVTDQLGCTTHVTATIEELVCLEAVYYHNYQNSQNWLLPIEIEFGKISILSKSGLTITTQTIKNGTPNHLNLNTSDGRLAPVGLYVVIIEIDGKKPAKTLLNIQE